MLMIIKLCIASNSQMLTHLITNLSMKIIIHYAETLNPENKGLLKIKIKSLSYY